MPVATTLKEMSSLMGSRVGVKHWRDFAFFQATGKAESLRHQGRLHSKRGVLVDVPWILSSSWQDASRHPSRIGADQHVAENTRSHWLGRRAASNRS